MLTNEGEPKTSQETIIQESKKEWVKVMQEEVRSLLENHTYDLVKLPQGKKVVKDFYKRTIRTSDIVDQKFRY